MIWYLRTQDYILLLQVSLGRNQSLQLQQKESEGCLKCLENSGETLRYTTGTLFFSAAPSGAAVKKYLLFEP